MNSETMMLGTGMIILGLYNTYFTSSDHPVGFVNEIVLLSTGALVIDHAQNDETLFQAIGSIANGMISIKGV